MPRARIHDKLRHAYLIHMMMRNTISPSDDLAEAIQRLQQDMEILNAIKNTRYLHTRTHVPKQGNLHVLWEYASDPAQHDHFTQMVRISPTSFSVLLHLIEDHLVFHNNSNNAQKPVEVQLATTLFRMGRYGNAASLEDIARITGSSEGDIKEVEKQWIDQHLGFKGLWREGWVMYDGTIIVLFEKPGYEGDAYYTRKGNYGLNAQIGNIPSNL
ncbi:hypothetical protein PLEOSDRAFT_1015044, partial [Pleurotus ostreatus PC15]